MHLFQPLKTGAITQVLKLHMPFLEFGYIFIRGYSDVYSSWSIKPSGYEEHILYVYKYIKYEGWTKH